MTDGGEVGTGMVPSDGVGQVANNDGGHGEAGDLVRMALEKGVDVEVLERLVALQERVTERNARQEFFDALASFQDSVPSIHKGRTAKITTKAGGQYGYTYAPLDAIAKAIRTPLRMNGLSYAWTVEDVGAGALSVVCVLRHIGGHEERSAFPVPVDTAAAMSGAQKHGAALTYGKRQSLTSVLGLTTTDEDTDAARGEVGGTDTLTPGQVVDLEALIKEAGADRERFLVWAEVEELEDIMERDLAGHTKELKKKRDKK